MSSPARLWSKQASPFRADIGGWTERQRPSGLPSVRLTLAQRRCCSSCHHLTTPRLVLRQGLPQQGKRPTARAASESFATFSNSLMSYKSLLEPVATCHATRIRCSSTATSALSFSSRTRLANNSHVTFLSHLFVPTLKAENVGLESQKAGGKKAKPRQANASNPLSLRHAAPPALSDLEAAATLLLRGGYMRQSSSGIYSLLTPGQRVQKKISRVVAEEMERASQAQASRSVEGVGASCVQLPTLLPSTLWERSGRWQGMGSDMYKLEDRHGKQWLLAPTAEEEVTALVGDCVRSERDLPVRVFQISESRVACVHRTSCTSPSAHFPALNRLCMCSGRCAPARKHRDEPRPRMGLIRTREFLMKDLYTFDKDLETANHTYETVRSAYARIFDRLLGKGMWKTVEADTGSMGGRQSHEYHVENSAGEDTLLSCDYTACSYSANSELAIAAPTYARGELPPASLEDVQVVLLSRPRAALDQAAHQGAQREPSGGPLTGAASTSTLTALLLPRTRSLNFSKVARHLAAPHISSLEQFASNWDWETKPQGPLLAHSQLEVLVDRSCGAVEPMEAVDAVRLALGRFAAPPDTGTFDISLERLVQLFPGQSTIKDPVASSEAIDDVQPASLPFSITHVDMLQAIEGDTCAACGHGTLHESRAVEVGHAFLLGTKYSDALDVGFVPSGRAGSGALQPFQMGCYGIGITRLLGIIAARALTRGREDGRDALAWPTHLAPYTVGIILVDPSSEKVWQGVSALVQLLSTSNRSNLESRNNEESQRLALRSLPSSDPFELSSGDIMIDDRPSSRVRMGAKLAEADLMGYPFTIIFGNKYLETGEVEVRHRDRPRVPAAQEAEEQEARQGLVKLEHLLAGDVAL